MKKDTRAFRSEAELVKKGRQLMRVALHGIESEVGARYEVPAPGGVPDMVIFSKKGRAIHYVITVEFKLRDWRRAIAQAFRHRNFGNEAYVVLDQKGWQAPVRHIEMFERANVGLVTVDAHDSVAVWHYPQPRLPFSSEVSQAVARALLAPRRTLPADLPFVRTTRGGAVLARLRAALGPPHPIHREVMPIFDSWSRREGLKAADSLGYWWQNVKM